MAARDKLLAETGLDEIKMILGWIIDFRRLRGVSLPKNKHVALTEHGKDLTIGMSSAVKELETMIGHLGPISLSGGARHSLFPQPTVRATAAGKELPENQDQPDLCQRSDPDTF
jgi:hypothetical protein